MPLPSMQLLLPDYGRCSYAHLVPTLRCTRLHYPTPYCGVAAVYLPAVTTSCCALLPHLNTVGSLWVGCASFPLNTTTLPAHCPLHWFCVGYTPARLPVYTRTRFAYLPHTTFDLPVLVCGCGWCPFLYIYHISHGYVGGCTPGHPRTPTTVPPLPEFVHITYGMPVYYSATVFVGHLQVSRSAHHPTPLRRTHLGLLVRCLGQFCWHIRSLPDTFTTYTRRAGG